MELKDWLGENNQIGQDIWHKKYQYDNETFDQWLDRVSGGNADVRKLIEEKKFLFGGRILSNRGLEKLGKKITLSNCYVITPPDDNIESIFDCGKKLARTFSYGGGCGIDIGKLRPRNAKVNNSAEKSTGAVSFMDLYSDITGTISQNGRRGALMISIPCDHPDLEEFIDVKTDLDKVTKANISIRITDDFMKAVKNKDKFMLKFESGNEEIIKEVDAYKLFHKICENNWNYAEPAMLFWDRIEKWNLLSGYDDFEYAGVNPCAEEPLPAGGSCLLGSINLSEFIKYDDTLPYFDFYGFDRTVRSAVVGLNEVLDEGLSLHPLAEQQDSVHDWRQIGLGIMGLADMLIKMGYTYGEEDSINLCDAIGKVMINSAVQQSSELAKENNSFPKYNYDKFIKSDFAKLKLMHNTLDIVKRNGIRNSQLLTTAPTGTISTMLGISGGIEPIFANYYTRKTESLHGKDKYYKIFTQIAWDYLQEHNLGEDESKLPSYFITSQEIPYENRIKMQATWQKYIDASISSTINLPNEATISDIENIYMNAWNNGLKGITVYRSGCKREGILTTESKSDKDTPKPSELSVSKQFMLGRGDILDVCDDLISYKRTIQSGCGKFYVHLDFDDMICEPLETWLDTGSDGTCERNLQLISRLMSLCLRGGIPIESIIDQCKSIKPCPSYVRRQCKFGDCSKGSSCPNAIGFALEELYDKIKDRYFSDDADVNDYTDEDWEVIETIEKEKDNLEVAKCDNKTEQDWIDEGKCPICHEPFEHEGGCVICKNDGWSKCS
jgi:ribonucleoside-diphosphate reductase alpha chain